MLIPTLISPVPPSILGARLGNTRVCPQVLQQKGQSPEHHNPTVLNEELKSHRAIRLKTKESS